MLLQDGTAAVAVLSGPTHILRLLDATPGSHLDLVGTGRDRRCYSRPDARTVLKLALRGGHGSELTFSQRFPSLTARVFETVQVDLQTSDHSQAQDRDGEVQERVVLATDIHGPRPGIPFFMETLAKLSYIIANRIHTRDTGISNVMVRGGQVVFSDMASWSDSEAVPKLRPCLTGLLRWSKTAGSFEAIQDVLSRHPRSVDLARHLSHHLPEVNREQLRGI